MVTGEKLRTALLKYIPEGAVDTCYDWIRTYRISVRVKPSRLSKYGDYRPPVEGRSHTITINHDLNQFAFLITFTHEVAHLTCFLKHRGRVNPHGEEWKREFRYLLKPFLDQKIFPDDISHAVAHYLQDPSASSCTNIVLMKALKRHDPQEDGWIHLEEAPFNSTFSIRNGKTFVKGEKLRKNFTCLEVDGKHKYFIHPLMEVKII